MAAFFVFGNFTQVCADEFVKGEAKRLVKVDFGDLVLPWEAFVKASIGDRALQMERFCAKRTIPRSSSGKHVHLSTLWVDFEERNTTELMVCPTSF